MTRTSAATLGGLGVILACGVITIPAVPFAPPNTCSSNDDCARAFPDSGANTTCALGACVSNSAFDPIFVVTAPSTALEIGGTTFALPTTYLRNQALAPCTNIPEDALCIFMPPLAHITDGFLLVSAGFGRALWPPSGLRPNIPDNNGTTLPTRVVMHPMWIDPASGHPMLASKLGLPLPDIFAQQTTDFGTGQPLLLAPTNGSTPLPGFVFSAHVPQAITPTDPSSQYAFEVIPTDPFDVFPPFVRSISPWRQPKQTDAGPTPPPDPTWDDGLGIAPSTATLSTLTLSMALGPIIPTYNYDANDPVPLGRTTYELDEEDGALSLQGWSLYVVDENNHRVSGRVHLGASTYLGGGRPTTELTQFADVYEATGTTDHTAETLIIEPPPTLDMPRLTLLALGNPGAIKGPFRYFSLPQAASVSGSVLRADTLQNTSAHITFFADGVVGTLIHADGSLAGELNYQKLVASDAANAYHATLPPGSLRAYVVPDDPDLALTVVDNVQVTTDLVQAGKTFVASLRTHVKGRAVLADGTPLYAADVVISASADLPLASNTDPLAQPREVHGLTDVNGNFDVTSDPGQVDISIRPQDGTRYPWIVLTNRAVLSNAGGDGGVVTLTLPQITVPLPTTFPPTSGVLTDSVGNPLARTIVSAYSFPPLVVTPDGGTPQSRGARLIGQTVSDASGNFQLFLAPPDSE